MNIINRLRMRLCSTTKRAELFKREGLNIGEGCSVGHGVSFGSEPYLITIGNHVRINEGVKFVTHDGGVWVLRGLANCGSTGDYPSELEHADLFGTITVGNNVHIGTNAVVMPGVTIGDNCIIGVGAIVTRNIPDNSVAVGVPSRVIETIEQYYSKHKDELIYTKNLSSEEKRAILMHN